MKTKVVLHGEIPNKSFWSYILLLFPNICVVPLMRTLIIKCAMPNVHGCLFEPGFRFYYGNNIFAENVTFANTFLMDYGKITIGSGTWFSKDCKVITAEHDPANKHDIVVEPVTIGKNVIVGVNAIILGGVTIGDNVTIGAGSVVTHDVPSGSVVAGNPAKIIRRI